MRILRIQRMKCGKGLTLIELLIVVAIIAILAAIAVPMYNGYMVRARRADAKTALEQLRAAQEVRRSETGRYTADLSILQANWGGPPSRIGDYDISLVADTAAGTFTGTAAAWTSRQSEDSAASPTFPLTINELGVKEPPAKWAK